MKTKLGRWTLGAILLFSVAFAAWGWLRPYEWGADSSVGAEIIATEVKRDRDYRWLTIHVKMKPGNTLDLRFPTRLLISDKREIEPADTRLAGEMESGFEEMWLKFWLEDGDLQHPLTLAIQGGTLSVKRGTSTPQLDEGEARNYTTNRWDSWLGY